MSNPKVMVLQLIERASNDPASCDGLIHYLPAHPHEGAVDAPPGDSSARMIARDTSKASGRTFNIAVAFEPTSSGAPALVVG